MLLGRIIATCQTLSSLDFVNKCKEIPVHPLSTFGSFVAMSYWWRNTNRDERNVVRSVFSEAQSCIMVYIYLWSATMSNLFLIIVLLELMPNLFSIEKHTKAFRPVYTYRLLGHAIFFGKYYLEEHTSPWTLPFLSPNEKANAHAVHSVLTREWQYLRWITWKIFVRVKLPSMILHCLRAEANVLARTW